MAVVAVGDTDLQWLKTSPSDAHVPCEVTLDDVDDAVRSVSDSDLQWLKTSPSDAHVPCEVSFDDVDDAVLAGISSADLPSLCPLSLSCVMYERAGAAIAYMHVLDRTARSPEQCKSDLAPFNVLQLRANVRQLPCKFYTGATSRLTRPQCIEILSQFKISLCMTVMHQFRRVLALCVRYPDLHEFQTAVLNMSDVWLDLHDVVTVLQRQCGSTA